MRPTRSIALLRTLAARQSAELVKAKLAEDTAVPASTITGYLDLLHNVGLVASIPPWTPNLAKREIGRPKTIVADSRFIAGIVLDTGQSGYRYADRLFGAPISALWELPRISRTVTNPPAPHGDISD